MFASRWRALWFCGAVLLTAYCSVPSPEETADGTTSPAAIAASHKGKDNPAKWWAPDKPHAHHG